MRHPAIPPLLLGLSLIVAACGGGVAPATPPPSGPPPTPFASGACAGVTPVDAGHQPEELPLTADPELEAAFPKQINGEDVAELASGRWVETLCMLGNEAPVAAARVSLEPALDVGSVSVASAQVSIDGVPVTFTALRAPGKSANDLLPLLRVAAAAVASGPGRFDGQPQSVAFGSKTALRWATLQGVDVPQATYTYSSGDILWLLDGVTESQASQVLAALP